MAAALQTARHAPDERVRQSIRHGLELRAATGPVAHNSTYGDHSR
ncbi:hypothetical protein [Chloroflexus aurantiacus]